VTAGADEHRWPKLGSVICAAGRGTCRRQVGDVVDTNRGPLYLAPDWDPLSAPPGPSGWPRTGEMPKADLEKMKERARRRVPYMPVTPPRGAERFELLDGPDLPAEVRGTLCGVHGRRPVRRAALLAEARRAQRERRPFTFLA
jgi:hypothetical protein